MMAFLTRFVQRLRFGRRTVIGIPTLWLWVFFAFFDFAAPECDRHGRAAQSVCSLAQPQ